MAITKLKVRLYPDSVLRKKCQPVEQVGPSERMLIGAMVATMHHEKGIGLAAPQVGICSRIFVADTGEGPCVFVNPKIVKQSGKEELEEGCLSIPEVNVVVTRSSRILVKYTDENNQKQEKIFDELIARVIQHENDHLHGKLIIDYATEEEQKKFNEQLENLEEQYRNQ